VAYQTGNRNRIKGNDQWQKMTASFSGDNDNNYSSKLEYIESNNQLVSEAVTTIVNQSLP